MIAAVLPEAEAFAFGDGGAAFAASTVGTIANGAFAGAASAGVTGGNVLKTAGLAGLQAGLFNIAGDVLQPELTPGSTTQPFLGSTTADVFVAHGLVGGIVSAAGGGNFGSGFLAGGVSSLAPSPVAGQPLDVTVGGITESAILGGAGSVLGGGKFANGAVTGAFGYLFNDLVHVQLPGGRIATEGLNDTISPIDFIGGIGTLLTRGISGLTELFAAEDASPIAKSAYQLGVEGETAVRNAFGIGDKVSIPFNGRTIIPDGLIPDVSISEVKNVGSLSFTDQLRTYLDFAQQNGLRFDLYMRPTTTLSGPLQNAIDSGLINRLDIPR